MVGCKVRLILGWLLLLLIAVIGGRAETFPCKLRETQYGKVCVCTADYCDYLDNPSLAKDDEFALISSSKQGLRFAVNKGSFGSKQKLTVEDFKESAPEVVPQNETILSRFVHQALNSLFLEEVETASSITRSVTVKVNRTKRYQKIEGFGGSFTGAVTYLLNNYKEKAIHDHLFKSFYANNGLAFNIMRISIGGCDFDREPWAYNEKPENETILTGMDELDPRDVDRVAYIKRLMEVSGVKNLRIKGAAWGPPRWMKTNNRWTGFGRLKKEYYQTWADYHLKWVDLMTKNGLPIWAVSTGNEPLNGIFFMFFVKFMSLGWVPQTQAVWVNDHFGPTIRNSEYKDLFIFGNDDQRFTTPLWFQQMNRTRPNVLKYINGVALHWYWDEIFGNSFVKKTDDYMGNKIKMISESCIGDKPWQKAAPLLGSWERGEKIARSFLAHLQDGFNGWFDWNFILDEQGGPNYVNNFVDAPVIANTTTYTEFYKQPMFYAMGHFSKLVPEGSVRVEAVASNVNADVVAFETTEGKIVTVVHNTGRADLDVTVEDTQRGSFTVNVPARSIHTLYYN